MLREVIEFVVLTALIVVVARFLLYQPAKGISQRLKFSEHGVGQLLGYLTSAPELVATIAVAATGLMATVAYNILSSNVINVFLAILAASFYGQVRNLLSRRFWREQLLIAISIVVPILLLITGQVESAWVIPFFLVGYIAYLLVIRRISADSAAPTEYGEVVHVEVDSRLSLRMYLALNVLIILVALVGLYFLGTALGSTVYELGTTFGVPEIVLGVVIGVVTSLPELTTFFSSYLWHRNNGSDRANEEVVHNTLASNASNLLLIQTLGLVVFLLVAT
jgi:Ca2+/Na+ antiporter